MTENETYADIQHNCPKDCPFVRKIRDRHVYLCTEYRTFLEIDKYGLPRRNGQCGTANIEKTKAILKKLAQEIDKFDFALTRHENNLLNNIICLLDASEREVIEQVLNTASLIKPFVMAFTRQPTDNNLLANTRALLNEYEKKYADRLNPEKNPVRTEQKQEKKMRSTENNKQQEADEQLRLRLIMEKQRQKNGSYEL